MSNGLKILVDSSPIRYPNGLWYYTVDLIRYLTQELCLSVDLVDPHFKYTEILNVNHVSRLRALKNSVTDKYKTAFVMTLRPRAYRKQVVIVHDLWPIMQDNRVKSIVSKLTLYYSKWIGDLMTVSMFHFKAINAKWCYPNLMPMVCSLNRGSIKCDIIIIGTETMRKRLNRTMVLVKRLYDAEMLTRGLQNVLFDGEYTVAIVGTVPIKVESSVRVLNLKPENIDQVGPKNQKSTYISLSKEEGFNRGAAIALAAGFKLILSRIPAHLEFFGESQAIFLNELEINKIESIKLAAILKYLRSSNQGLGAAVKINKNLKRVRQNVLENIIFGV